MAMQHDKCLVVDVDGTLCPVKPSGASYADLKPYPAMVERLRALHKDGFRIILHSSRNMRTYDGNVGEINAKTLPVLLEWLGRHDIPYDEVHMGKPWAGHTGFYIDDRAIRPDEFLRHELADLEQIVDRGRERMNSADFETTRTDNKGEIKA